MEITALLLFHIKLNVSMQKYIKFQVYKVFFNSVINISNFLHFDINFTFTKISKFSSCFNNHGSLNSRALLRNQHSHKIFGIKRYRGVFSKLSSIAAEPQKVITSIF